MIGANLGTSLAYRQQFSKSMLPVLELHLRLSVDFLYSFFRLDRFSINCTVADKISVRSKYLDYKYFYRS